MTEGSFLDRLTPEDLDAMTRAGRHRKLPARSQVFAEGDPAYEVLVVEHGAVKLTRASVDGREVGVAMRSGGEILGEVSAIDGGVRSASATTTEVSQLIAVPFTEFRALLETRASISRALLDVLAARLRGTTDRLLEFGTIDALSRVCRRLVEFAERQPGDLIDGVVLELPHTQQEIASLSGLSREAVVKALRTLRELGWIGVAGRSVTLLDLNALRERAAG